MNNDIFTFFNNFSQYSLIEFFAPLFADLPIFFLPIFLLGMWAYYTFGTSKSKGYIQEKKYDLMHIFYACVVAITLSSIIQHFIDVSRPETAISGAGKLLLEHIPDASFPSDHASVGVAFVVALLFAGYKKVFWAFLPWIVLMNLSRIVAGVHWPYDIVAGTLVGIISAYISFMCLRENKFVKKGNSFIISILSYIKL